MPPTPTAESRHAEPVWPLVLSLVVAGLVVLLGVGLAFDWNPARWVGLAPRGARATLAGDPLVLCSEPGGSGFYLLSERRRCDRSGAVTLSLRKVDRRAPGIIWTLLGDQTELIGTLPNDPRASTVLSLAALEPGRHAFVFLIADRAVPQVEVQNAFSLDSDRSPDRTMRLARMEKLANRVRTEGGIATLRTVEFEVTSGR